MQEILPALRLPVSISTPGLICSSYGPSIMVTGACIMLPICLSSRLTVAGCMHICSTGFGATISIILHSIA